ncbi:MAG TPA: hypothetical protein PLM16_00440 [Candidatus Woesebacteria bacterium]|nr:hypothetical protein [Candidatus Woesebacteria bacterium]
MAEQEPNRKKRRNEWLKKNHPEARRFFQETFLDEAVRKVELLYEHLLTAEQIMSIELNPDHGWAHIRRVLSLLSLSITNSAEVRNRTGNYQHFESPILYDAMVLAARFHDIAEQLYHIKEKHAQLGALITLYDLYNERINPTTAETQDWLNEPTIFLAVIMIYYHSSSKEIGAEDLNLTEEKLFLECSRYLDDPKYGPEFNGLRDKINKGHKMFQNLRINQKGFFDLINQYLQTDPPYNHIELLFLARRLIAADKLDSSIPGEMVNLRTIISSLSLKLDRPFVKPIAVSMNRSSTTLDQEILARVRMGEGIAPDDFSRILYELFTDYSELQLTAVERRLLLFNQQRRAENLIALIESMLDIKNVEHYLNDLFSDQFRQARDPKVRKMIAADKAKLRAYISGTAESVDNELLTRALELAHRAHELTTLRLASMSMPLSDEEKIFRSVCSYYPESLKY